MVDICQSRRVVGSSYLDENNESYTVCVLLDYSKVGQCAQHTVSIYPISSACVHVFGRSGFSWSPQDSPLL